MECERSRYSSNGGQRNADTLEVNQTFLTSLDTRPDTFGISLQKPKFPQYAVVSKRLESFKTWPEYLPLKPDVFVEAGLVYTGVGDSVRCYHCGGGLRNWEAVDIPFVEHAKWYPTCPHVLLVKGQSYVDALTRGESPPETETQHIEASHEPQEDIIKTVAAQSCIQNGFTEESVKEATDLFIREHGHSNFKGTELCQIIFNIEQSRELTKVPNNATGEEANVLDCKPTSSDTVVEEEDDIDNKEEDIEELLSENQRLKENQTCKICLDDIADVIFLPCGHMVSCPQCAPALNKCPICRTAVKGYVKAYLGSVGDRI